MPARAACAHGHPKPSFPCTEVRWPLALFCSEWRQKASAHVDTFQARPCRIGSRAYTPVLTQSWGLFPAVTSSTHLGTSSPCLCLSLLHFNLGSSSSVCQALAIRPSCARATPAPRTAPVVLTFIFGMPPAASQPHSLCLLGAHLLTLPIVTSRRAPLAVLQPRSPRLLCEYLPHSPSPLSLCGVQSCSCAHHACAHHACYVCTSFNLPLSCYFVACSPAAGRTRCTSPEMCAPPPTSLSVIALWRAVLQPGGPAAPACIPHPGQGPALLQAHALQAPVQRDAHDADGRKSANCAAQWVSAQQ